MASPTDPKAPFVPASGNANNPVAQPPKRPSTPPPRPSRPPLPPPRARPQDAGGLFAQLPELPKMAGQTLKRKLTLVGMLQASQGASSRGRRWVLPGAAAFVLAGIVAAVVYRETLVAHLVPKKPVVVAPKLAPVAPVLTAPQKAALALAAGSDAYANRDYGKAVASFEQALNLDPTLADAHRSLGIVHADLHDEAEAMAHYQKYIEMVPHGRDSARVKKIIDDYNTAHTPAPQPPPAPAAPISPPKVKGHRGRLHRHEAAAKP